MDDVPLCPEWWPKILWDLHFIVIPHRKGPVPPPVNYPIAVNDMMAALSIHTFTYLMMDQEAAQGIRTQAEERLASTAQQLSKLHDQSLQRG
jgi:hypothetical protein